ncbi:uncharacterized protein [Amphiura filiformis]|uniref:uncharacterized protein n=1 Tax=Amphiura filiformis TaxID=82378 RepID=UPI003B224419
MKSSQTTVTQLPETFVKEFHDEDSVRKMQYNPLGNTGMNVSVIGYGGAPLGGWYGDFHEEKGVQSVRDALVNGINYIDTSPWYGMGKSEMNIGRVCFLFNFRNDNDDSV